MSPEPDLVIAGPADVVAFLRACGGVPGEGPPCGGPPGEGPLVEAPGAPGCADRFEVVLGLALADAAPRVHVVCGAAVRDPRPRAHAPLDAQQVADLAAELVVGAVVWATVDPGAQAPTRAELRRFVRLRHQCAQRGVALLDRVVIGDDAWWSWRHRVLLDAA